VHNGTGQQFKHYLRVLLGITTEALTIYFSGHGAQIPDASGDEGDSLDEVMIFEKGDVGGDNLASILRKRWKGKTKVVLLSDCCRSGTNWDIPEKIKEAESTFPPNIIAIAACLDDQFARQELRSASQAKWRKALQGMFTLFFFELLKKEPRITPNDLIPALRASLQQYKQEPKCSPTRETIFTEPIFPERLPE
jgi:hypothetical protein